MNEYLLNVTLPEIHILSQLNRRPLLLPCLMREMQYFYGQRSLDLLGENNGENARIRIKSDQGTVRDRTLTS